MCVTGLGFSTARSNNKRLNKTITVYCYAVIVTYVVSWFVVLVERFHVMEAEFSNSLISLSNVIAVAMLTYYGSKVAHRRRLLTPSSFVTYWLYRHKSVVYWNRDISLAGTNCITDTLFVFYVSYSTVEWYYRCRWTFLCLRTVSNIAHCSKLRWEWRCAVHCWCSLCSLFSLSVQWDRGCDLSIVLLNSWFGVTKLELLGISAHHLSDATVAFGGNTAANNITLSGTILCVHNCLVI